MVYSVKELFFTLQGEGARTGRASVFCRFSGCNLWSGREADRGSALCSICDTDFVGTDGIGGGKFSNAENLADAARAFWEENVVSGGIPYIVCTGGEPLLQIDGSLIEALHTKGFEIAVETNGTQEVPNGIDWVCVSPKRLDQLVVRSGNELKLLYPLPDVSPESVANLEFENFFLQPLDTGSPSSNTQSALEYCSKYPQWRLCLQTHKFLGIR